MKKSLVILFIIMAMVSVAGCTSQSDVKNKIFKGDNITFEYPADWVIANSQANDTIVAVADPKSVNPQTGYAQTVVVIQKRGLEGDFYQMYNKNYATLFNNSSYQRVSEGNITIGSYQALENTYIVTEGGLKKKQRAIWIQRGNEVYVILCSALISEFDKERANFDIIINSFNFIG
ncbi:MAG: PsbP-related protein [Methanothermobacter sp.]|nr:PsbP-related protein [Methanothermobacter sp.]